jgi:hypothetical protein
MSLGALLVVNSVEPLLKCNNTLGRSTLMRRREVFPSLMFRHKVRRLRESKGLIRGMGVNLFAGCFGIPLALLSIAFSWEGFQADLFLELSLAGVIWGGFGSVFCP